MKKTDIGLNIVRWRTVKNLTKYKLWKKSGVSWAYICGLEDGTNNNPTMVVLEKLAAGLDITVQELLKGPDKDKQQAV